MIGITVAAASRKLGRISPGLSVVLVTFQLAKQDLWPIDARADKSFATNASPHQDSKTSCWRRPSRKLFLLQHSYPRANSFNFFSFPMTTT